jgi:hypothetical protein
VRELLASQTTGTFAAKDKSGKELILEWKQTDIASPDHAATMLGVWEIARQAYSAAIMK